MIHGLLVAPATNAEGPLAYDQHMSTFDVDALRRRFPALAVEHDGRPLVFFDGPGGTQVPDTVIEAVARYYRESNANSGGPFATSIRSDEIAAEAHAALADFLGATAEEIVFGANMTTLTLHVSRSITATMAAGDEIVVTELDHEANVGPWKAAAADRGLTIRTLGIRADDCTLDLDELDGLLGPRTRLVAFGWASNAVGTINPVAEIVDRVHRARALAYVDAVHAAPHLAIDVAATGADFVACSTYKFFGPHSGVLYGRKERLDSLPTYKIRPSHHRFETGTANFEGLAGALAAVEYIADVGRAYGGAAAGATRREATQAGMLAIRAYEMDLYRRLAAGLERLPGIRLYGITDPARFDERTPTAAFTLEAASPEAIARQLGRDGICVWHGDFYATGLIERLGLVDGGGVVRVGLTHYNTADEVDRLLAALERIAAGTAVASPA
jgi:cysteine desulfurase family protein (TIGR01976 family)